MNILFMFICLCWGSPKKDWQKLQESVEQEHWLDVYTKAMQLRQNGDLEYRDQELDYFIEIAEYELAIEANNVSALLSFMQEYPNSFFYQAAYNKKISLEYQHLQQSPTQDDYQRFLQKYNGSIWQKEILESIEEIVWKEASQQNTVESYKIFMEKYPTGHYHRLAQQHAAVLIYKNIRRTDTLSAYQDFIKNYPSSHFVIDARERSEHLAWDKCQKENSIESFQEFQALYPDSEHFEIAKKKELTLAWNSTEKAHNLDGYRSFQKNYPLSLESGEAERLELDLFEYIRPAYPGELKSNITRIFREDDGRYRLYVDVQNDQNEFVGGLGKENFSIYDAGYKVTDFEVEGMESNRFVDVVFVLDVSRSMQDKIETVKQDIIRFSQIMTLRNRDYRLGVVSFVEEIFTINGQPYQYGHKPVLTKNPNTFREWIDNLSLEGGSEENDYLGLDIASQLNFRPEAQHILILVTDEPPSTTYAYPTHTPISNKLLQRDMIVYAAGPYTKQFEEISQITGGIHYPLENQSFFTIMETIIQKISKQYKIRYLRPPNAPPVINDLQVRFRIKPTQALVQVNQGNSTLPGSIKMDSNPNETGSLVRLLSNNDAYCSHDKGKNWKLCSDNIPKSSVKNVVYDSKDKDSLYMHLNNKSVVKRSRTSVTNLPQMNNSSAITSGTSSKKVYVANSKGIHLALPDNTLKNLISFEKPYDIKEMYVNDKNNQVKAILTLQNGDLVTLTPDGVQQTTVNPCNGNTPRLWQSHPTRKDLAFIGCSESLLRSTTAGTNWQTVALPEHPEKKPWTITNLLLDPSPKGTNFLLTTQGLMQSTNFGKTWTWSDMLVNNEFNIGAATITNTGSLVLADAEKDIVYNLKTVANKEFFFSSLFYSSGSSKPSTEMFPHLDEVATKLRNHTTTSLYIEGHTDSYGKESTNLKLSQNRAEWIARYLISQGVEPERIVTQWLGETKPLFSNKTKEGRAKNRRVEILVLEDN